MTFKKILFGIFSFLTLTLPLTSGSYPSNQFNTHQAIRTPFPPALPSDLPISPTFALELIQSNLELVELTFDNPENSFNIITDPRLRLLFLQGISSSLNDLSTSVAMLIPQISSALDPTISGIINSINTQIEGIDNMISTRVSQYLLPLNVSMIDINPDFQIHRLDQDIQNFITFVNGISVQVPQILQPLNESLYDLSLQISKNTSPQQLEKIISSISIKLSDISGELSPILEELQTKVIFPISTDICLFAANCNFICGIYNNLDGVWTTLPSKIYDLHQVYCETSFNQSIVEKKLFTEMGINNGGFYTVALFQNNLNNDSSSDLKPGYIVLITFGCLITLLGGIYLYRRFVSRKRFNSSSPLRTNRDVPNYQTIPV